MIEALQGTATALRAEGSRVTLQQGDSIYQGDVIKTSGDGAVGMTFIDGTTFSLGEEGRMILDQLIYDSEADEGTSAFSVVQGVFFFVSGAIAKSSSDAMTVRTPVATIGVRGTMVAVKAGAEGEENVITLLEEAGSITGEIMITNAGGSQVLNVANQTITATSFFVAPTPPIVLPQVQIDELYSGAVGILQYLGHEGVKERMAERNAARGEEREEEEAEITEEDVEDLEPQIAEEAVAATEGTEVEPETINQETEDLELELAEDVAAATEDAPVGLEVSGDQAEAAVDVIPEAGLKLAPVESVAEAEAIAQAVEHALASSASEDEVALAEASGTDPASAAIQAFEVVLSGDAAVDHFVTTAAGEVPEAAPAQIDAPEVSIEPGTATAPIVTAARVIEAVDLGASVPTLETASAAGLEDMAIPLSITAALTDTDTSERLTVNVNGVPAGAKLSAGTDNGDGSRTLAPQDLIDLELTPPANASGSFDLTVSATTTEIDSGDTATPFTTVSVSVAGVADVPVVSAEPAAGFEDTGIALDIEASLIDVDASEVLFVTVGGVPTGASLSAGMDNGNGSWTLTPSELAGLEFTPPPNASGEFTLTVSATAAEADTGDTATSFMTVPISVASVADAPQLIPEPAMGYEASVLSLAVNAALVDTGIL